MLLVLLGISFRQEIVADPLSRHRSFSATIVTAELAQLSLCSVTDADTIAENDEAAATDVEMLSQIP